MGQVWQAVFYPEASCNTASSLIDFTGSSESLSSVIGDSWQVLKCVSKLAVTEVRICCPGTGGHMRASDTDTDGLNLFLERTSFGLLNGEVMFL